MSQLHDPVDRDFHHFCRTGEPEALGRVFDAVAGQLLRIALWLCGNRADAEDVLQRTFVQAIELRARYESGRSAVAWLLGLLGNQAKKQRREREARAVPAKPHAVRDPVVEAAAAELAAAVEAVRSDFGDAYRDVLRLHLQEGLGAHEIAVVLKRPASSVRTQLMRALQELRRRLPAGFVGGMAPAWLAIDGGPVSSALREAVIAAARSAVPARVSGLAARAPSAVSSLIAPKLMIAAVAVVVVAVLLLVLQSVATPSPPSYVRFDAGGGVVRSDGASVSATSAGLGAAAGAERRLPVANAAGRATLTVRAVWSDTGEPARGQVIQCFRDDHPLRRQSATTGDQGNCVFEREAGDCALCGLGFPRQEVTLEFGEQRTIELSISRGIRLAGRVVDSLGQAVPAAEIVAWNLAMDQPTRVVATTDATGRFTVDIRQGTGIHAQKAGHAPSLHRRIDAEVGKVVERTFALRGVGCAIEGVVRDRGGSRVPGAEIVVGSLWPVATAEHDGVFASEPPALPMITDDEGRFRVDGLSSGVHPVRGWAIGCAPWSGSVEVAPVATAEMTIVLAPGAMVSGVVRDAEGRAVPYAFGHLRATNGRDEGLAFWADAVGRFAVDSLGEGDCAAEVHLAPLGACTATLSLTAGAVTEWNPVLDAGRRVRGRVVDDAGSPIAKAAVGWDRNEVRQTWTHTDTEGRFVLTNLPESPVRVAVYFGLLPVVQEVVEAPCDDLLLTVGAEALPTARVRGRVVDEQGMPVPCRVHCVPANPLHARLVMTDADGNFAQAELPRGDLALYVEPEGRERLPWCVVQLDREANLDVGTFALAPGCSLTVHVTDLHGRPPKNGAVSAVTLDGLYAGHANVRDGLAEVAGLRSGTYRLDCSSGLQRGRGEVVVVVGNHNEAAVKLTETLVLCKVRCTSPYAMSPETKAEIEVEQGEGRKPLRCLVPVSDEFFDGANVTLPVGSHRFVAWCGKRLVGEADVVLAARPGPEAAVEVVIPLRASDGR